MKTEKFSETRNSFPFRGSVSSLGHRDHKNSTFFGSPPSYTSTTLHHDSNFHSSTSGLPSLLAVRPRSPSPVMMKRSTGKESFIVGAPPVLPASKHLSYFQKEAKRRFGALAFQKQLTRSEALRNGAYASVLEATRKTRGGNETETKAVETSLAPKCPYTDMNKTLGRVDQKTPILTPVRYYNKLGNYGKRAAAPPMSSIPIDASPQDALKQTRIAVKGLHSQWQHLLKKKPRRSYSRAEIRRHVRERLNLKAI